jgi:uncharacterized protein Usg
VASANFLKLLNFLIARQRFSLAGFKLARKIAACEQQTACAQEGVYDMGYAVIIKDYRLTTAEIVYRLPDHPEILQSYIWQAMDMAPDYPELQKFLAFWRRELEGKLHSVRIAANPVARTGRVRHARMLRTLH